MLQYDLDVCAVCEKLAKLKPRRWFPHNAGRKAGLSRSIQKIKTPQEIPFLHNRKPFVTDAMLVSRRVKSQKFKMLNFQNKGRYPTGNWWKDIILRHLQLSGDIKSEGLAIYDFKIWWRHVKTSRKLVCCLIFVCPTRWFSFGSRFYFLVDTVVETALRAVYNVRVY